MKNLKNLAGLKTLSKGEQKSIEGGRKPYCGAPRGTGGSGAVCAGNFDCPPGEGCFITLSGNAYCHCL